MMQTEMSRTTREDKKYLEEQIKELNEDVAEMVNKKDTGEYFKILVAELRRLRRMR